MKKGIKVRRIVHKIYKEYEQARKKYGMKLKKIVGKWQYIYKSKKGEISLIEMKDYFGDGIDFWEIYELGSNGLVEDVERFDSKEKAEKRIEVLL